MRSVICFLNAKNMKPAEIHCQLCEVYGEHAMSSAMVRRLVRLFHEMCMMISGAADRLHIQLCLFCHMLHDTCQTLINIIIIIIIVIIIIIIRSIRSGNVICTTDY